MALPNGSRSSCGRRARGRKELERLLAESRKQANQFVKDMERTVSEITAREEPGKG